MQRQTNKTTIKKVEATPQKFSQKIMTKKVLNELTILVNEFNSRREEDDYRYLMTEPLQYKRGRYSVNIRYKIFFTLDMNELMRFALKNGLLVSLLYSNVTGKPYMAIQ